MQPKQELKSNFGMILVLTYNQEMACIYFHRVCLYRVGGYLFQMIRRADTCCLGRENGLLSVTLGSGCHCLEPG